MKDTGAILSPVSQYVDKVNRLQRLKKAARQGNKPADKGAYLGVSDRSLPARLTQQAKIPSTALSFEGIFAFVGFVSALRYRSNPVSGIFHYAGRICAPDLIFDPTLAGWGVSS